MKIFASIIIMVITISSLRGVSQTSSIQAKNTSPKEICFNVLDYGALVEIGSATINQLTVADPIIF